MATNHHWNVEAGLRASHLKLASRLGLSTDEVRDMALLDEVEALYLRLCRVKADKPGYVDFGALKVTFDGNQRLGTKPMTLRWASIRNAALRWKQRKESYGLVGAIQWGSKELKGMALEAKGA